MALPASEKTARYRARHPDRVRESQHRWALAHPDIKAANHNRDRARQSGAEGSHTIDEWEEKKTLLGGCCFYCGRSDVRLDREHKVPLSRGGSDAIDNIVPACKPCNAKKRSRTAREFLGQITATITFS